MPSLASWNQRSPCRAASYDWRGDKAETRPDNKQHRIAFMVRDAVPVDDLPTATK